LIGVLRLCGGCCPGLATCCKLSYGVLSVRLCGAVLWEWTMLWLVQPSNIIAVWIKILYSLCVSL